MKTQDQIAAYIASLPEPKRGDLQALHERILGLMPGCRLWFLDGRDEHGKVVSNPNIGYGEQLLQQAGGKTREFYQVGASANTTGISVYIMGLEDRKALAERFGAKIGKASVTSYCIKFKSLKDIDVEVLLGNRPRLPQFTNARLRQMEQMGGAISRVRDMFPNVVQSDLQLKPQQCGGPVVDLDGNVVGLTIAQADRTRSFFIPASEVVSMLDRPTVESAVARIGNPPAELPNQMARWGGQAPRMIPAPDPDRIGRARRNVHDMERLIERLHEEMDAVGEER